MVVGARHEMVGEKGIIKWGTRLLGSLVCAVVLPSAASVKQFPDIPVPVSGTGTGLGYSEANWRMDEKHHPFLRGDG